MKLFDGGGAPNPRRVRIFLAEKGITVPIAPVDLGALEHKSAAFATIDPVQRVPVLVPDDGNLRVEVRGELAAILALAAGSKKPGLGDRADAEQIKMVAGVGFEPTTFRL